MRLEIFAFLLGVLLLQIFKTLPVSVFIFLILLSGLVIFIKFPRLKMLAVFLFGFVWASWYAHGVSAWTLPKEWEGKPISVQGYIASIPEKKLHGNSFLFSLTSIASKPVHALIKLSAPYPDLQAGSEWRFTVKLKRIHSLMNPGGFDYEAWAFQSGIRASGSVMSHAENKLLQLHSSHFFSDAAATKIKRKNSKRVATQ